MGFLYVVKNRSQREVAHLLFGSQPQEKEIGAGCLTSQPAPISNQFNCESRLTTPFLGSDGTRIEFRSEADVQAPHN